MSWCLDAINHRAVRALRCIAVILIWHITSRSLRPAGCVHFVILTYHPYILHNCAHNSLSLSRFLSLSFSILSSPPTPTPSSYSRHIQATRVDPIPSISLSSLHIPLHPVVTISTFRSPEVSCS